MKKFKLTAILTASILIASVFALATLPLPVYGAACPSPITATTTLTASCNGTITIIADNITLDCAGFDVIGSGFGTGILLNGRTKVTIKDCNVTGFSIGIKLTSSSDNTLTSNTANSNDRDGIVLGGSSGNTLTDNTANSNRIHGIQLLSSSDNILTGNTASNNFNGIFLSSSSDSNTLTGNTASNNFNGIFLSSSSSNTLTDNTAKENSLFDVSVSGSLNAHCNNIIENTIGSGDRPIKYFNSSVNLQDETLSELILCNADGSTINNVTIDGSATKKNNGLIVILTDSSSFTNIVSSNNRFGIELISSSDNTLTGNTVSNNFSGIFLLSSSGNTLTGNTASNNSFGILLSSSSDNTLTDNIASNNNSGIFLSVSNDNTLTGNTVNSNDFRGIVLSGSSTNTLMDNTVEANKDGFRVFGGFVPPGTPEISVANQITGNLIAENEHGIHICLSLMQPDNTIFPNKFMGPQQAVFVDRFC